MELWKFPSFFFLSHGRLQPPEAYSASSTSTSLSIHARLKLTRGNMPLSSQIADILTKWIAKTSTFTKAKDFKDFLAKREVVQREICATLVSSDSSSTPTEIITDCVIHEASVLDEKLDDLKNIQIASAKQLNSLDKLSTSMKGQNE